MPIEEASAAERRAPEEEALEGTAIPLAVQMVRFRMISAPRPPVNRRAPRNKIFRAAFYKTRHARSSE
jgi:hypothetical protein